MSQYPAPEATWEERLAVMAQSLVYTSLCHAGYCADNFGMRREQFISAWNQELMRGFVGFRFYYDDACRGSDGIFLGPFCLDMFNIARNLEFRDAEEANNLASFYSQIPFLDPPPQMVIDGHSPVSFAYRDSAPPPPVRQPDLTAIPAGQIQRQSPGSSSAARMSDAPVATPSKSSSSSKSSTPSWGPSKPRKGGWRK